MSEPRPYQSPTSAFANTDDEQTWFEFLRTAGSAVASTAPLRSDLEDRKRRLASSDTSPERRGYPYPAQPSALSGKRVSGMSGGASGSEEVGTLVNPLDLTTPPRQRPSVMSRTDGSQHRARGSSSNSVRRRQSDIALPKWQPDHEIGRCPVCQTEFTFWYRKHHCRKCGRVVCANCSPHRITIPRQYIVQLPVSNTDAEPSPSGPVSVLEGGEVVRVCNPCVPDPWTPAATQRSATEPAGSLPGRPLTEATRPRRESEDGRRAERYRYTGYIPPPTTSPQLGRNRSASHQPTASILSRSIPSSHDPRLLRPPPYRPGASARPSGHRHTQSHQQPLPPIPPFDARPRPTHPTAPSSVASQPRPRRRVKEEDECPVCGIELPPGESLRETHVQDCIASRFSGHPSSSTSTPPLYPSLLHTATSLPSTNAPQASGSTPPNLTTTTQRPRAPSHRPRGMALYHATEKDCVSADGSPQECIICFEEFTPGEQLGRMECLCVFHRACIRGWWDARVTNAASGGSGGNGVGVGCPTHMLHD